MKATVVNGGHTTATNPDPTGTADSASTPTDSARFEGLTAHELIDVYRCMVRSRKLDDKEIQLKNQSRIFFQISGAGHEAIQVAAGMVLKPGHDWFHPYYRDRALVLQLGMTPLEMLLAGVGAEDDPSNAARQMPSHWGHAALHIVSGSSATTTQLLHAVGCAEAGQIYSRVTEIPDRQRHFHADEVVFTSLGEGSTSEGEFWEAVNAACTRHAPVLFLVEDNGYAISGARRGPDAGRRYLADRPVDSGTGGAQRRRHRLPGQPPRHARSCRLRACTQRSRARPRARRSPVLALVFRRRASL